MRRLAITIPIETMGLAALKTLKGKYCMLGQIVKAEGFEVPDGDKDQDDFYPYSLLSRNGISKSRRARLEFLNMASSGSHDITSINDSTRGWGVKKLRRLAELVKPAYAITFTRKGQQVQL